MTAIDYPFKATAPRTAPDSHTTKPAIEPRVEGEDSTDEPGDLPKWIYQVVGGLTLMVELSMIATGIWFFVASGLFTK